VGFSFLLTFKFAYSFDNGFSAFSHKLFSGCKTMAILSSMNRTILAKNRKNKPKSYCSPGLIPLTVDFNHSQIKRGLDYTPQPFHPIGLNIRNNCR
jgi:hypothetical protein